MAGSAGDYRLVTSDGRQPAASTPIGMLDVTRLRLVPRSRPASSSSSPAKSVDAAAAASATYRLTVHLPGKQLFVWRVTGSLTLTELRALVVDKRTTLVDDQLLLFAAHSPERRSPPIAKW